eukprot:4056857-Prymnesium_polylepis.1
MVIGGGGGALFGTEAPPWRGVRSHLPQLIPRLPPLARPRVRLRHRLDALSRQHRRRRRAPHAPRVLLVRLRLAPLLAAAALPTVRVMAQRQPVVQVDWGRGRRRGPHESPLRSGRVRILVCRSRRLDGSSVRRRRRVR